MNAELLGGERVEIFDAVTGSGIQAFERTMSEERERLLRDEPNVIDLWRLVTPMSAKQKRRLDNLRPLPTLDTSAPLDVQIAQGHQRIKSHEQRERINARSRIARVERRISDNEIRVEYHLGHGIPVVGMFVLWDILDDVARNSRRNQCRIDNTELTRRITASRSS